MKNLDMAEPWYMNEKEAWGIIVWEDDRTVETRTVGTDGVTAIKRVPREGMHCNIPYLEIWRGDVLAEEWCQHAIKAILWVKPPPKSVDDDGEDIPF